MITEEGSSPDPSLFFARCRYGSPERCRTARMNVFWSYWYFHLPNFVLAAVMYTVIGRLVLGFFVPENWDNFIWRGFRFVTDPAIRAVRYVTPSVLAQPVVLIFAALWLMALRVGYFVMLFNAGLAPGVAPGN